MWPVLRMRDHNVKEKDTPVVIMFAKRPSEALCALFAWLPDVYFLEGSMLSRYHLQRVRLFDRAIGLVMLANPVVSDKSSVKIDGAVADADTICLFRSLFEKPRRCAH